MVKTKMQIIERMLRRQKGCTAKEVKEAVGWQSVSIPQRAEQLGIKIEKRIIVKEVRYYAISPKGNQSFDAKR